jgi:small subunit ribosomal protein S10
MEMQRARITLTSPNFTKLDAIAGGIKEVAIRTGVKHSGIIPLPTKKLVVPTRKTPAGGGTESYERWQLRIHKRIIDITADDITMRRIMRIEIPEEVQISIDLKEI